MKDPLLKGAQMPISQIRKVGIMMDLLPQTDQDLIFDLVKRLFKAANPPLDGLTAEKKNALDLSMSDLKQ